MKLTREILEKALQLANAATPGPWGIFKGSRIVEVGSTTMGKSPIVAWPGFDDSSRPQDEHVSNAEHIAHNNPEFVKSVVTALIEARRLIKAAKAQFAPNTTNSEADDWLAKWGDDET